MSCPLDDVKRAVKTGPGTAGQSQGHTPSLSRYGSEPSGAGGRKYKADIDHEMAIEWAGMVNARRQLIPGRGGKDHGQPREQPKHGEPKASQAKKAVHCVVSKRHDLSLKQDAAEPTFVTAHIAFGPVDKFLGPCKCAPRKEAAVPFGTGRPMVLLHGLHAERVFALFRAVSVMHTYLDFEKPIAELEGKVEELKQLSAEEGGANISEEIARLETKARQLTREAYAKLTPWQKALVARHPHRPHPSDYAKVLIEDFTPLAGDRVYGEDHAIIGGLGRFRGRSVVLIGNEKGSDTQSRVKHNFGAAKPEGYRKARRLMDLADRFGLPVITLVDTAGAYPGLASEERGVAEAIARSTDRCLSLGVPLVSVIIGEGGSGGAIALATGNRVLMLEHAIYTVISPEGCASILWRDSKKAQDAAAAMKITAQDLLALKVIDGIISEPEGGAHRDPAAIIQSTGEQIEAALKELEPLGADELRARRREKFLAIGRQGLA